MSQNKMQGIIKTYRLKEKIQQNSVNVDNNVLNRKILNYKESIEQMQQEYLIQNTHDRYDRLKRLWKNQINKHAKNTALKQN